MAIVTGTTFLALLGRSVLVGAGTGTFLGAFTGADRGVQIFAAVTSVALAVQLLRSK